jgi:hypothetical protein
MNLKSVKPSRYPESHNGVGDVLGKFGRIRQSQVDGGEKNEPMEWGRAGVWIFFQFLFQVADDVRDQKCRQRTASMDAGEHLGPGAYWTWWKGGVAAPPGSKWRHSFHFLARPFKDLCSEMRRVGNIFHQSRSFPFRWRVGDVPHTPQVRVYPAPNGTPRAQYIARISERFDFLPRFPFHGQRVW